MIGTLRAGPLTVIEDLAIVFDDDSRIRWSRGQGDRWLLAESWPNTEERAAVDQHLGGGGCMLVLTDAQPITTYALGDEVPAADGTIAEGEVVEVSLPHFDWLPDVIRARGEAFLRTQRERFAALPALLRPPVVLEGDEPFSAGKVSFALLSAGVTRARLERELSEYLAYLHSTDAITWRTA